MIYLILLFNHMSGFEKNDEDFVCLNCKKQVSKLQYTSRDHCPYCLYSLHIDHIPGDRKNKCLGLMKPIALKHKNGKIQIEYDNEF